MADNGKIPERIKVDKGYFDMGYPTPPKGSLGIYPDSVVPFVRADIADEHKRQRDRLREVNAEMLVALRKFNYEMGQYYDYDTGTGNNLPGGIMEAWTGARVAIAKAGEPTE